MKSKSPRTDGPRRPGYTLLELMIAMGLGVTVAGLALYAYVNADRAKSQAVVSQMLKVAGQRAIEDIAKKLAQSRRVYDRDAVTDAFLARLPIKGFDATVNALAPGLPATPADDLVMPLMKSNGSFLAQLDDGTGVPDPAGNAAFDQASVGNAIFFMTKEPHILVREASAGVQNAAFGSLVYRFNAYRFHFYFLARRDLGLRPRIRPGSGYTYSFMHWESAPYLDKREVEAWMAGLVGASGSGAHGFINTKLTALRAATTGIAGAFDRAATAPDSAFFRLQTADYATLTAFAAGTKFTTGRYVTAMPSGVQASMGELFAAFNTVAPTDASYPAVALKSLSGSEATNVPAFADGAANAKPYGFEVMIAGSPASRVVLLRLAIAGRTTQAKSLVGDTYQQVVQIFDN